MISLFCCLLMVLDLVLIVLDTSGFCGLRLCLFIVCLLRCFDVRLFVGLVVRVQFWFGVLFVRLVSVV